MQLRKKVLWKVPVFVILSGFVTAAITMTLVPRLFAPQVGGVGQIPQLTAGPICPGMFRGLLFWAVLCLGGLWLVRKMTYWEIAVSAGIFSVIYLALLWAFPGSLLKAMAFDWAYSFSVLVGRFVKSSVAATLLGAAAPFLFVPFGRGEPG